MKVSVAAYKLLVEIAQADGKLGRFELEELQHYHDALGIDEKELLRVTRTPVTERVIEGSEVERLDTIRAMVMVALADGRVSRREYRWGRRISRKLGLSRFAFAQIVRQEKRQRSSPAPGFARRSVATWGLLAALFGVGWNASRSQTAEAAPARRLQAIAQEFDGALVLVETHYRFIHGEREAIPKTCHGSGFFASADGHIVTNKHVVQPWKFQADAKQLEAKGYRLDPDSICYAAWRCGSVMEEPGKTTRGDWLRGDWSTAAGDLRIECTAPDRWVKATRTCRDGTRRRDTYHGLGPGDLAVMRAESRGGLETSTPFIPLAVNSASVRVLDSVVVLGFPRGPAVFERGRVISTPSIGEVGKVEESLMIRAPMDGGNSGGPIVSLDGEVIGVAARKFPGGQGLARCLRCEEVRRLLDGR